MKTLAVLWSILKAFPEIVELVETIKGRIEQAEKDRKVHEDIRAINEAFKNNDPEKLRRVFNS